MADTERAMGPLGSFDRVNEHGLPETVITANNGCPLAVVGEHAERKGTANHIVKCVNAHDDLVETLETLRSDCQTPIDMYERNGPEFTSPQGNEYESTSYVMAKFAELVASIDAALARAGGAS